MVSANNYVNLSDRIVTPSDSEGSQALFSGQTSSQTTQRTLALCCSDATLLWISNWGQLKQECLQKTKCCSPMRRWHCAASATILLGLKFGVLLQSDAPIFESQEEQICSI